MTIFYIDGKSNLEKQQFESNWAIFTKAILNACGRGSRLHLAEKEVGN